jgi:hydroxymethylpyrimidine pyrophosphatase-like HAD family hydrolase
MKKDTVIFDLDGTLALIEHRRKYISGKRKNWNRFFEECDKDLPNVPVIRMNQLLHNAGYKIIILSGRSKQVEKKTYDWLKKHEIKYHMILMREERDYTPDDILKKNWLDTLDKEKILCVFDDRDKVVNMWRDNNITCFQVAEGDF